MASSDAMTQYHEHQFYKEFLGLPGGKVQFDAELARQQHEDKLGQNKANIQQSLDKQNFDKFVRTKELANNIALGEAKHRAEVVKDAKKSGMDYSKLLVDMSNKDKEIKARNMQLSSGLGSNTPNQGFAS